VVKDIKLEELVNPNVLRSSKAQLKKTFTTGRSIGYKDYVIFNGRDNSYLLSGTEEESTEKIRLHRKYTLPPNKNNKQNLNQILQRLQGTYAIHKNSLQLTMDKLKKKYGDSYEETMYRISQFILEGEDVSSFLVENEIN